MAARKALLIGVPEYSNFSDIPAALQDVRLLAADLASSGYDTTRVGIGAVQATPNVIKRAIHEFLSTLAADDVALVYFSGHGFHYNGYDYLVPCDGYPGCPADEIDESFVRLDLARYAAKSRAETLVLVVDACREGMTLGPSKSIVLQPLGTPTQQATGQRKIHYILSCKPGEFSHYAPGPSGTSYFTQAFAEAVRAAHPARTIREVIGAAQRRLDELTAAAGVPSQEIRYRQPECAHDEEPGQTVICNGTGLPAAMAGGDPWATRVRESPLWGDDSAASGDERTRFRDACVEIAGYSHALYRDAEAQLGGDPWRDAEFAERTLTRLEWFARHCQPDGDAAARWTLKPAEAALLIAAPFVREAVLAQALIFLHAGDPLSLQGTGAGAAQRRTIESSHRQFPQLVRAAESLRTRGLPAEHDAIAYWLLHSAVFRSADIWQHRTEASPAWPVAQKLRALADSQSAAVAETLTTERLFLLARCVHGDPERITRGQGAQILQPLARVRASTAAEIPLREQFIAALACLGGWLAIDTRTLGQVLPDHIGLNDPVDIATLVPLVRKASWNGHPHSRLSLDCPHPALDLALREHVTAATDVLARLSEPLQQRLALTRLDADDLKPTQEHGRPAYTIPHLQFRLAHDEVRELLMGERLYGDPTLAIRELYQNALDACRYRRARLEYLHGDGQRRGQPCRLPSWKGRIAFRQDRDDSGRAYIECEDNGIGMGRRELESCFACAGRRFADTSEFLDEQSDWLSLDPPVAFYPNSQFGIGVFSYFMLADEIFVETCRLGRDGKPGETLEVRIGGSGSLFRIRPAATARTDAGTRVRLYLSRTDAVQPNPFSTARRQAADPERISCTHTLGRLLWVAEFATTATDLESYGAVRLEWEPGSLRLPAHSGAMVGDGLFHSTVCPHVWWLAEGQGALLSDGLFAGQRLPLAVVDLRQRMRPDLSVDRTRINRYDAVYVKASLCQAVASLLPPPVWLDWEWYWRCSGTDAGQAIVEAFREANVSLSLGHISMPVRSVGFCPADGSALGQWMPWKRGDDYSSVSYSVPSEYQAVRVGLWRARLGQPVPAPVAFSWDDVADSDMAPEDVLLLSSDLDGSAPALEGEASLQHVLSAAQKFGWSVDQVCARLRIYTSRGWPLAIATAAVDAWKNSGFTAADMRLLSRDLDGEAPWLDGVVPQLQIDRIARHYGWSADEVQARLNHCAKAGWPIYLLPADAVAQPELAAADRRLLSRDLDGMAPWISGTVSLRHVVHAATTLGFTFTQVCDRLKIHADAGLGISVLPAELVENLDRREWGDDDRVLLSSNLTTDGLLIEGVVPLPHILNAAVTFEWNVERVCARLQEYADAGWPISVPRAVAVAWDALGWTVADSRLVSQRLDGAAPWLEGAIPPGHIVNAAAAVGWTVAKVCERLQQFIDIGYPARLPPIGRSLAGSRRKTEEDKILLSKRFTGDWPWADAVISPQHLRNACWLLGLSEEQGRARFDSLRVYGVRLYDDPDLPVADSSPDVH